MNIGKTNSLRIMRQSPHGLYLEDTEQNEVLLPNRYIPENETEGWAIDNMLDVFVYTDSEDRLVATTDRPLLEVDQVGALKVVASGRIGAFLDWGLPKDLLVPHSNQFAQLHEGQIVVTAVYLDTVTNRIVGSTKLGRFFNNDEISVSPGDKVDIVIAQRRDMGYRVIVNNAHWGMLYDSQIFREVDLGDRLTGWVTKITEDLRIDISLQQQGFDQVKIASDAILELIAQNEGAIDVGDRSDSADIQLYTGMSKKVFKRAVGYLLKAGKVIAEEYRVVEKR